MYPNNINPMMQYQQRPNYYEQQQQNFFLKGRPVVSLDEARASMIDLDGSVFYFPDVANKRIYTKQIGPDGIAVLTMYEQKEIPEVPKTDTFVTREELNASLEEIKKLIDTNKIANSF